MTRDTQLKEIRTSTNQAIQDAIDAGWDDTNYAFSSEDKKGSYIVGPWEYDDKVFLDPLFWQCLGVARGWGFFEHDIVTGGWRMVRDGLLHNPPQLANTEWLYNQHRFIDHLASGRDAESFFETL